MSIHIKLFGVLLAVLVVLDTIWLGFVAKDFYVSHMGPFMAIENGKARIGYGAAGAVYFLLTIGLLFFALERVSAESGLLTAFFWGWLFGLVVYGVYDFTNRATLSDWPVPLIAVDMLWGAFACGLATLAAKYARDTWFVAVEKAVSS